MARHFGLGLGGFGLGLPNPKPKFFLGLTNSEFCSIHFGVEFNKKNFYEFLFMFGDFMRFFGN